MSFARPDLTGPMLGHLFGYIVVLGVMLLGGVGSGVMLLGWWLVERFVGRERHTARRVINTVVGLLPMLLFILPAILLVLFSPIIFAYAFGNTTY